MTFEIVPMLPGDLYDSARRFGDDTLRALSTGADPGAARAGGWKQAVEMGWPMVLIADTHGGAGGTLADVACLVEATAGSALALPIVDRGGVVPTLLAAAGTPECTTLLAQIAGGKADVASLLDPATTRLDLTVGASHYLIALPAQKELVAVKAEALPVGQRYRSVDGRTMADVVIERLYAAAGQVVARGEDFDRAWTAAGNTGALLVCAEAVGAQGALLKLTIEYLATRKQFGHALATFQVLRHRVVDMYVGYECTRGLVRRTLQDAIDGGRLDTCSVSLVKSYTSKTSRTCAESGIQLHGGMGMTDELLAARLAERLLSAEFDYGDRYVHLRRLALSAATSAAASAPAFQPLTA